MPPDTPNLSAFQGEQPGASAPMGPQGAAIPRIVFEIEKTLDVLASALPEASEKIDQIKSLLRDVMMSKVKSQSLQERPSEGSPQGGPVRNAGMSY